MKKLLLMGIFALAITLVSNAQFTFSVKPGLNLNGASFGYKVGNIVPYAGLQFASINVESKYKETYSGTTYEDDTKIKAGIYMPYLGVKFFVVETDDLKAGFNATVFKPIISEKNENDGEEIDPNYENTLFGSELGFTTEYFFSEQFSIGGEFGYRLGIGKSEYVGKNDNIIYNDDKLRLNMTYISASLNYYF